MRGILTSVKYDDHDNTYTTVVGDMPSFDATKDYSDLMGQQVKVMYTTDKKSNDTTLLGIYATEKNKVLTGLLDDVDNFSSAFDDGKATVDGTDYDFATDIKVVAPNGATVDKTTLKNYYNFTLVDNNKDDDYDYLVVQPFAVAQIDVLTSSRVTLSAKGGTDLENSSFDLKKDDVTLYDKAAEDDFVVVVDKANTVSGNTEITAATIVTGEVSASKGSISDVRVDGTWYSVVTSPSGDNLKVNNSYNLAMVNGFVFDADKTAGSVSAENILYVEKVGALDSGIADGVEAKVWFADGTKQTVTVTSITAGDTSTAKDGYNNALVSGDDYDIVKTPATKPTDPADATTDEISNTEAAKFLAENSLFTYAEKEWRIFSGARLRYLR